MLVLAVVLVLMGTSIQAQNSVSSQQPRAAVIFLDSTREQDGLIGSVRRVQTESARLEVKSGLLTESPRQLLEITTYDLTGKRSENLSYAVASASIGKQEYKYDDKGNIAEMTLLSDDGSVRSRETYKYEFDDIGNWTKMLTTLVVFEGGGLKYEPVEFTYRKITYYFDQTIAEIVESPSVPVPLGSGALNVENVAAGPTELATPNTSTVSSIVLADPPPGFPDRPEAEKITDPSGKVEAKGSRTSLSRQVSTMGASSGGANTTPTEEPSTAKATFSKSAPPENTAVQQEASALYKAGRERFDAGDLRGAVEAYQQSVQSEPSSAEVYLSMAYAYHKLNKNDEALRAFKQSIRLNPDMAEAHYGLGLEYFRMRRNKDATEAFERAIHLRPDMAKAHFGLAIAEQELGRTDRLLEEYRILETLDRTLAKQLAKTFPGFKLPCRIPPYCK